MTYRITDDCLCCGACADECPSSAIGEGEDKYVIDQDKCVECGTCAENCPAEAIVEE
ncbi:MAG TPA: ferredoxin [Actinobacteria bacterium]|nr:ferredoxin [Actinomycetota bacterium]